MSDTEPRPLYRRLWHGFNAVLEHKLVLTLVAAVLGSVLIPRILEMANRDRIQLERRLAAAERVIEALGEIETAQLRFERRVQLTLEEFEAQAGWFYVSPGAANNSPDPVEAGRSRLAARAFMNGRAAWVERSLTTLVDDAALADDAAIGLLRLATSLQVAGVIDQTRAHGVYCRAKVLVQQRHRVTQQGLDLVRDLKLNEPIDSRHNAETWRRATATAREIRDTNGGMVLTALTSGSDVRVGVRVLESFRPWYVYATAAWQRVSPQPDLTPIGLGSSPERDECG